MDSGRHYPAMNPVFSCTIATPYWSGTAAMGALQNAWAMSFGEGTSYYVDHVSEFRVRCVRDGS
jgi:predicted metal-dependent hydrolase